MLNQHQYQNKKIIVNDSAECSEERLLNQCQYQKEKLANESADHRQERLANQHQYQKEKNFYNSTITDKIIKFHANISRGPEYICSCCNELWYKHSVITAEKLGLSNSTAGKYLLTKTRVDGIEWICQSCYKHLKKDKIPPCAAKNGMSFPAKRDFFEVNNTVNMLPRLPQESGTIKVQLKRLLEYMSSSLSLNVRPNKILQAGNWLATNSILYREQRISFSTDRATSYSTNLAQSESKTGDVSQRNEQISDSEDIIY